MVLHDHQANPHVHLSVRAESHRGKRLNARKADLHRWRETFAKKLRGWDVHADATRQITRGELQPPRELWQTWARDEGQLQQPLPGAVPSAPVKRPGPAKLPVEAWARIAAALGESPAPEDRELAQAVKGFINRMPAAIAFVRALPASMQRELPALCARRASRSVMVRGARGAPLFEVGPAPGDCARAQVHWTRKRAAGDQPVDGRAVQTGCRDHRRKAREQASRSGSAAGGESEAIHARRRCGDVRSLVAVVSHRSDELSRNVIGGRLEPTYLRALARSAPESVAVLASEAMVATLPYAKQIISSLNSHMLRHGRPGHLHRRPPRGRSGLVQS
jgi:hypothetical protein